MWTEITRRKYQREGQRYASDLTDAEWALIAPQMPAVKRFGVLRRKPELTTDTLALTWRNDRAPLFAANDYLRRYYINLTDRTYAPDVPWDGYADIWWDDFASTTLHSDARVPIPDSDASEVLYMFMTPKLVT